MTYTVTVEDEQRQLILLALAELSLTRPGWHHALGEVAAQFPGGRAMYEDFREFKVQAKEQPDERQDEKAAR